MLHLPGGTVLTPGSNRHKSPGVAMAPIPEGDALILPAQPLSSTPPQDEAEEEDTTVYQNKDIVVNSIVIEGAALVHCAYDSVYLSLDLDHLHLEASLCLAREKGSKKRSYNVQAWPELAVSASQFKEKVFYLSVMVADTNLSQTYPQIPVAESTMLGSTSNSVAVPVKALFAPTFEVSRQVQLPTCATPTEMAAITVTIHGLSREAKEARMNRILSMKPVDLLNLRFEPVALDDDDYDDNDFDTDDDKSHASKRSKKSLSRRALSNNPSAAALSASMNDENLQQTLYPDASYNNLMSPIRQQKEQEQKQALATSASVAGLLEDDDTASLAHAPSTVDVRADQRDH